MSQTTFQCSRVPHERTCSVQITGDRQHVVDAATSHRAQVHNHDDPDLETKVGNAVDEPDGETPYATWG